MTGAALFLEADKFTGVQEFVIDGMDLLLQLSLGVTGLAVGLLVAHGAFTAGASGDEQSVNLGPALVVAEGQFALKGSMTGIAAGIGEWHGVAVHAGSHPWRRPRCQGFTADRSRMALYARGLLR